MAALSNMQHRHGMVYLEDTSSGEFEAGLPPGPITPSDVLVSVTAPPHFRTASGSSSKGAGSEGSYEEIYSSSSDDECDSYHSEGDDFAEYWDPYREFKLHTHLWPSPLALAPSQQALQLARYMYSHCVLHPIKARYTN